MNVSGSSLQVWTPARSFAGIHTCRSTARWDACGCSTREASACPYGHPGAYWALLGPEVEFRRTDYDREAAAARIRQSAWPGAEDFARENVLFVPSEEDAFAFFGAHGGP